MSRRVTPRIAILVLIVVALIANALVFRNSFFTWIAGRFVGPVASVGGTVGMLRSFAATFLDRVDLTQRVMILEAERDRLRADTIQLEEARREAEFFRAAAGMSPAGSVLPVSANLFSYLSVSGAYRAVLNRGDSDGVMVGDVVITEARAFIGVVAQVFTDYATVIPLRDATFEVTARVVGSDVAGLLRADDDGSLLLDLVRKDETVTEGSVVVTSGDDRYPPGLILGSVRTVNNEAATLFQLIRIDPETPELFHGRVIVVRP